MRAGQIRLFLAVLALQSGCGRPPVVADVVQREFWATLRDLCGQAFPGRLIEASAADRAALAEPLVLEIWQCYPRELRLAFHAGSDHSRVWVLTPSSSGLRLSHSVHSPDGTARELSGYGGETAASGTLTRQVFLPDDETLSNVPSARGSEWVIEIVPGTRISYMLAERTVVVFRADFDLTRRVARQAAPWGYTRLSSDSTADSGRLIP